MILLGLDDTDNEYSRGTNQLAKALARLLASDWRCERIVRHQLLEDERIPCTSKNGSASLLLEPRGDSCVEKVIETCREAMLVDFIEGSDPGLCVAAHVPREVIGFGHRCQQEIVTQQTALSLASACGIFLTGLGGTNGGLIGALAAIGLGAEGNDGRIVQWREFPDDLTGRVAISSVRDQDIDVRHHSTGQLVESGTVDLGKHLRPNLRDNRAVLFVEQIKGTRDDYIALKRK
ncbi:MAG: hypothetical protein KDA80_18495 [Planctomycetaceae bacterium]|nr:hypothetical protein [Planctomycetaceae bacterium]